MHLFVGSDHAGFRLKESIVPELRSWGHTVDDLGSYSEMPVDFPDIARAVCLAVREHEGARGLENAREAEAAEPEGGQGQRKGAAEREDRRRQERQGGGDLLFHR